ncbi:F-BAR domain only protein 2 isoform X7 [Syngnathoides biaculeatus]|uniref:F-BAR domain only protein 2 isoform X7 n=1 Tax=Syngnathoides biaculeatus TaxID=300417 RepID=UPI002ADD3CCD|nr:F-BAR domain only protein 2 isoform X7 [Syngnathoides biaculeatus]
MITPYFVDNFWGEKNNGFDVLYHNMKHGQISSKELTDFIRERSVIEEAYARSMTKLVKTAGNFSQLGTFAPLWEVFKGSTEKLAICHMELVRKLQELIKEVHKYVEEQAKAHKKTKEEVASTLEAVQNIQSTGQALQKSKENYNAKTVEQERLRKEGATQRDVDKAGIKAKKATETYKSYVEKYAYAKSDFELKMEETAQKFQDIEESHIVHMKDIIKSYSLSVEETHLQIGEVHNEFVRNVENTSVESLIQKLAESKGTGKERPGPIEFEECNAAIATEVAKPRRRKPFGIPGRRKDKDTDSTESTEAESNAANGAPPGYYGAIDIQNTNVPRVDDEGFCIPPDAMENDAKENSFYSSSDSEDEDEPRKFHVEIKPVQPNDDAQQNRATLDELKASIGNIVLSPSTSGQIRRNQSSDELAKGRVPPSYELTNNDLLSLDPLSPFLTAAPSQPASTSADLACIVLSSPSFVTQESQAAPVVQVIGHMTGGKTGLFGLLTFGVFLCFGPHYHPTKASAETAPAPERSPPSAEQSKDVSSFSSSASSPRDSPENLFRAPRPPPARAHSAPITLPPEPADYVRNSEGGGEDDDPAASWSRSRWIAFGDNVAPGRRPGPPPRPRSGRAGRFLSDDSADAYGKAAEGFSDAFFGWSDGATLIFPGNVCDRRLRFDSVWAA